MAILRSFLLVACLVVSSAFVVPRDQVICRQRRHQSDAPSLNPRDSAMKMFLRGFISRATTRVQIPLWSAVAYPLAQVCLSLALVMCATIVSRHCVDLRERIRRLEEEHRYYQLGFRSQSLFNDEVAASLKAHRLKVADSHAILCDRTLRITRIQQVLMNREVPMSREVELDPANAINMPISIVSQDLEDTIDKIEIRGTPTVIMVILEEDGLGQL